MLHALSLGAPPHGGIAPGIDRIVMLLAGEENLREVVLFPMNQRAEDLMMGAPSEVDAPSSSRSCISGWICRRNKLRTHRHHSRLCRCPLSRLARSFPYLCRSSWSAMLARTGRERPVQMFLQRRALFVIGGLQQLADVLGHADQHRRHRSDPTDESG